ncbi:MAG TPA: hypothetical protein VLC98_14585 [Phnomibacter sp.]|nr:hypothetical protein [Phnomibacter sp.]
MKAILVSSIVAISLLCCKPLAAQLNEFKPDFSRSLFHERLDKAQYDLMALDGKADKILKVYQDDEMNQQLNWLVGTRIDEWQKRVELNTKLDHNKKLTYLRGMTELLYAYAGELRKKTLDWSHLSALLNAYEDGLLRMESGKSLLPAIKSLPYDAAKLLAKNFAYKDSPGVASLNHAIFLKYIGEHPEQTLRRLSENSDYPFTDSLVSVAARKRPEELISYAQARNSQFGRKIASNQDPLVQMIVALGSDKSGQLYFPFLDQLSKGKITKTDIAEAVKDSGAYYKLLVKTQVEYAGMMANGDTPVVTKGLQDMLHRKSMEIYVNTINGLHDSPNNIRFKKIQGLNIPELYYLIVLNEAEIYTSSYVYVYNRIYELMQEPNSDSLLILVNHDKYKKFLTMASNYNTLNSFLAKMSKESATKLMSDFVSNLEKGRGSDDIEDAVDVANAYASITQPEIRSLMLAKVKDNLAQATFRNNQKGMIIYRLEKVIMESSDSELDTNLAKVNISDSLGIPPVYEIENKMLRDSLGRIVLQMYFYGDASGKGTFNHFLRIYSDKSKWAMKSTPEWVQYTSIGTPVPFVLFANRALDETNDEDENAQRVLIDYMTTNGFEPAITVHRGHSYYLPYTIKKMLPSKVVVLGSCGAYHNLADVLRTSPDAYIISSKQVGYGEINVALFTYLVDRLKMGQDVKWPAMMQEVAGRISAGKQEGYNDYVFPHQNLGALFIKAYKIASNKANPFDGITLK